MINEAALSEKVWVRPPPVVLVGKYCRLEPFELGHSESFYKNAVNVKDAENRYQYLFGAPPKDRALYDQWVQAAINDQGKVRYAVIDLHSDEVLGSQCLMNIETKHGSIEIGSVLWGPLMARSRIATEAFYLFSEYVISELGYRRYEWKCNNANSASKKAAVRFGFQFEGIFRNHMLIKGVNRDTAWFSIINSEWPELRGSFEQWLDASNFDSEGRQLRDLKSFRPK
ncbi:N-acetyltransferase [archaeon]|nr:MAG: N-acetyltransferase [archaeon]